MRYSPKFLFPCGIVAGLILVVVLQWPGDHLSSEATTAAGPEKTRATTTGHVGHSGCVHSQSETVVRRVTAPVEGIATMLDAADGDVVEWLWGDDQPISARVFQRDVRSDGRVAVAARLENGGILYIVSDGELWEGRLKEADRSAVWILEGNRSGGVMRKRDLSTILCAALEGEATAAGLPPISVIGPPLPALASSELELAEAQPIFNSRPGAKGVIYLDFDGETVSGTLWNADFTDGDDIVAAGSGFSNAQIQLIWETISEDYRPFNLNVTTDRSVYDDDDAYPVNRKTMIIFTPDNEWYGAAGGVAYVDMFGSSFYDEPGWVFVDQLLSNSTPYAPFAAEAGSHESGHVLGLLHDGTSTVEYYAGQGSGTTSWAPIMGNSYQKTVTHWSKGEYPGANNTEDDLAIIAGTSNGVGYVSDDHGNSTGSATILSVSGGDQVSASGSIEGSDDLDMFTFDTDGGAISITVNNATTDPNLDIRLRLLDTQGNQVSVSDPATSLDATLSVTVAAGTFYLEVDGAGAGDLATGYSDYGSLGDYVLNGTLPPPGNPTAEILSPAADGVSIPSGVGLVLVGNTTGGTLSWDVVQAPPGGSANFSSPTTMSTRCEFDSEGLYRLRLQSDGGTETAEDEIFVSVEAAGSASVYANRGASIDLGPDRNIYDLSVTLDPTVSDDGVPAPASLSYEWTILSGNGSLSDPIALQPILDFGAPEAVSLRLVIDDGAIKTFAEGTLTGRFVTEILAASNASIRVLTPLDGSADGLWTAIGFDDSGWQPGVMGVGYDVSNPASQRIFLPLIGVNVETEMYKLAGGCYVRVPFTLTQGERLLKLSLRMKYDDGFVAYVNGMEVARANAPAGLPAWNSLALSDRNDEDALTFQSFSISLPPGVLVDGTNILGLHGMNSDVTKQEAQFLLVSELEGILKESPYQQTIAAITDPLMQDPSADPDDDGVANLVEHAGMTDPITPDLYQIFTAQPDPQPEGQPAVQVRLRLPAVPPDDVRYELQCNTSLAEQSWVVIATRDGAGEWTGLQPAATLPAGNDYVDLLFARPETTQEFYRLGLTLIVP